MEIIHFISQPWHWAFSGVGLVLIMVLLLWFGGEFGVSSNLRTFCAMCGAGKKVRFFEYNWKGQLWNLVFIASAVLGGFLADNYLASERPVQVAESTKSHLSTLGIHAPENIEEGMGFVPDELFVLGGDHIYRNLIILLLGGFLVGFGARYAGGCTSGHAISGLSNLQWSSLIAVVGFFIGGLLMTWFIMPRIF